MKPSPQRSRRRKPKRKVTAQRQTLDRFTDAQLADMERRASREMTGRERQALETAADEAYERVRNVEQCVRALRAARKRQGLTQAQIDEMTGIGRANLSRLENLHLENPTLDTVFRYAQAVGLKLTLQPDDATNDAA